jgi:hypothetical protein
MKNTSQCHACSTGQVDHASKRCDNPECASNLYREAATSLAALPAGPEPHRPLSINSSQLRDLERAQKRLDFLIRWITSSTARRIIPPPDPAARWALIDGDTAVVTAFSAGDLLDAALRFDIGAPGRSKSDVAQVHLSREGLLHDLVTFEHA